MKCFLLTPYKQNEVGIVFFKMPNLHKEIFDNRVLILPAPKDTQALPSGLIEWGNNDTSELPVKVRKFLHDKQVQEKVLTVGGLNDYVNSVRQCQLKDGEYCHHELVITNTPDGPLKTCWHHDNEYRVCKLDAEKVRSVVKENKVLATARVMQLALKHNRTLTVSDVILYCAMTDMFEYLRDDLINHFIESPPPDKFADRDGASMFEQPPKYNLGQIQKNVLKLKIDDDPPAQYMLRAKPQYIRSDKWLRWVKSQPCVCCGRRADDPHHLIGNGGGIMGGKTDDLDAIPLCREHHNELHRDVSGFELKYGTQKELWHDFFIHSIKIGAVGEEK